jgi:hypothetical protein
MFQMRSLLRFIATRIGVSTYERLMAHSVLLYQFDRLKSIPTFEKREALWAECLSRKLQESDRITYVEFGVHTGISITYFAQKNLNEDSVFIGLDSFEGLPEDWGVLPKGTFDVKGKVPQIDDSRVTFIKGWFQNTWDQLAAKLLKTERLIVHYDADLYSSTLFALSKIDSLKRPYIAIFDEFAGHEARALHNYLQSFSASVSFLGQIVVNGYPIQVMCEIVPNSARVFE